MRLSVSFKRAKTAIHLFRCAVNPLYQLPIQVIQGNGVKLIDLRGPFQRGRTACSGCGGIRKGCLRFVQTRGGHRIHPGIAGNGHPAAGQHMTTKIRILRVVLRNIRLFRLLFLPRLVKESACFPVTFLSLFFRMIFVNRPQEKPLAPSIRNSALCRTGGRWTFCLL